MKHTVTLAALLLATIFSACGKPHATALLVVQVGVEKAEVEEARKDLEDADGSPFLSDAHADLKITVMYGSLEEKELSKSILGGEDCEIRLRDGHAWKPRDVRNILLHEIGHCFDMDHAEEDTTDVMYPYYIVDLQDNVDSFKRFVARLREYRGL